MTTVIAIAALILLIRLFGFVNIIAIAVFWAIVISLIGLLA